MKGHSATSEEACGVHLERGLEHIRPGSTLDARCCRQLLVRRKTETYFYLFFVEEKVYPQVTLPPGEERCETLRKTVYWEDRCCHAVR